MKDEAILFPLTDERDGIRVSQHETDLKDA